MTVPELVSLVLGSIRHQFYADRVREFKRDERALTKAIARYGYEFDQRGWPFDAQFVLREIMTLLQDVKKRSASIKYLPTYLHEAVGRSIGQRAEELNDQAKSLRNKPGNKAKGIPAARLAGDVIKDLQIVPEIRERTDTEVLALLYQDIKRGQRKKKQETKLKKAAPAQRELF